MCRQKKIGVLRGDIGAIRYALTPSFRKPRCSPPKKKNELSSQEMQLKILHFSSGLKTVRGCREADIHLFVKQIPPIDSWHKVYQDRSNFHPLMPALTLVALLERYLVLETAIWQFPTPEHKCTRVNLFVCTPQTRAYGLRCNSHEVVQFARGNTRRGWRILNMLARTRT